MQTRSRITAGIILASMLFAASCAETITREMIIRENTPAVKKDCSSCHRSAEVTRWTAELKKPVTELCVECHPARSGAGEHKTGVVPAAAVKKIPLYNGEIVCTTCHDPHRNTYSPMLRLPQEELCAVCHKF